MFDTQDLTNLLPYLIALAAEAGDVIMTFYQNPDLQEVKIKSDDSPVGAADLASNELIVARLRHLTPDVLIVSEEDQSSLEGELDPNQCYWLVDPLDGTRGFVSHSSEFAINIALIENGSPILGIIYIPAHKVCYYALRGGVAIKKDFNNGTSMPLAVKERKSPYRVVMGYYKSRLNKQQLVGLHVDLTLHHAHSALKYGLIAEGIMDIYPCRGLTSFWDTAAGQVILEQTGGLVVDLAGKPLQYSLQKNMLNPQFLALGDASKLELIISIFNKIGE